MLQVTLSILYRAISAKTRGFVLPIDKLEPPREKQGMYISAIFLLLPQSLREIDEVSYKQEIQWTYRESPE